MAYQELPYEVSVFLKIKPRFIAVSEMLVSSVMTGFVSSVDLWQFFLASPVSYVLTGFVIYLAACKRKRSLVKTAQYFNSINMVVVALSFHFHIPLTSRCGVPGIVLVVCDVLVFIFSVVVASTSSSWCFKPKSRSVAVSYVSTAAPVNSIGLLDRSDPSASPQPVSSVMYVLPATYGQVLFLPPPNYNPTASEPPPYNSLPTTAPATNYNSVPSSPPPAYDQLRT